MQYALYIPFLSIALLLASLQMQANPADSTEQDSSYFYRFQQDQLDNLENQEIDPVYTRHFQRYQKLNNNFPYLRIGNPGHAMYSPLFDPNLTTDPYADMYHGVYPYLYQDYDVPYFRVRPPFTSMMYVSGPKKEEVFDLVHTRNFGRNLNVALHLNRQGSIGFYNNLKTRNGQFNATVNYQTGNNRYAILANYMYNKREFQENGGFKNFTSIENPETEGSSALSFAKAIVREESFNVFQTLGFGNKNSTEELTVAPVVSVEYTTGLTTGFRYYEDPGKDLRYGGLNIDYYPNIYFDSTQTRDSLTNLLFRNKGGLFVHPGKFKIGVTYLNEFADYNQRTYIDTIYRNNFAGAVLQTSLGDAMRFEFEGNYGVSGYRAEDMDLQLNLYNQLPDSVNDISYHLSGSYQQLEPHFTQLRYISNNFQWNNNFKKSKSMAVSLDVDYLGYNLSAKLGNLSNYIYYGFDAKPAQYTGNIQFAMVSLGKLLNWRNLFLDNQLTYQYFSNRTIIPMPNFLAYESIYYRNRMFNKVLEYRVGFDVFYYTNHKGYGYMAPLNQWYLQDDQTTGSYPYVDLFISFHLKRAYFFFKLQHFNKGMTGNGYFQVAGYPVPPRSFKFGIRWCLFD